MGCAWRAEQSGKNGVKIRPFGRKNHLFPKLFSPLQTGFAGAESHFPLYLKGFFAVGRAFFGPAFCTSGLNICLQGHVMMLT
jgi:hypothetical protein